MLKLESNRSPDKGQNFRIVVEGYSVCGFGAQSSLLENIGAPDGSERERNACVRIKTDAQREREREFRGGNRRRG